MFSLETLFGGIGLGRVVPWGGGDRRLRALCGNCAHYSFLQVCRLLCWRCSPVQPASSSPNGLTSSSLGGRGIGFPSSMAIARPRQGVSGSFSAQAHVVPAHQLFPYPRSCISSLPTPGSFPLRSGVRGRRRCRLCRVLRASSEQCAVMSPCGRVTSSLLSSGERLFLLPVRHPSSHDERVGSFFGIREGRSCVPSSRWSSIDNVLLVAVD